MMKALICGISGQDGAYLARFLLNKGYQVVGTSRDAQACSFHRLHQLQVAGAVTLVSLAINDFRSVLQVLNQVKPDEIYNLAGQSSVGLSFDQPVETLESINIGTLNLLEAIRFTGRSIKFYNAGSSECFGDTAGKPADEQTAFHPRSPYAVAKASAYWLVSNYREAYCLFACTGILFNHESPLRPERFVTRKIIKAACDIATGTKKTLQLGNIEIFRDWGWAPEYVEAMWLMLQQRKADDFVIATGQSHSLKTFIELAFQEVGLDWRDHLEIDPNLKRPADITVGRADPAKAKQELGWQAKTDMEGVIQKMIAHERLQTQRHSP